MIARQIKKNTHKETYAGLTYEYMEEYILTHESSATREAVMSEYSELRLISQCHSKGHRYPTIKKWFVAKYPSIVKFGMEEDQDEILKVDPNNHAA